MKNQYIILVGMTLIFLVSLFNLSCNSHSSNCSGTDSLAVAENLLALDFDKSEQDSMLKGIHDFSILYREMRKYSLPNSIPPSSFFNPLPVGFKSEVKQLPIVWNLNKNVKMPVNRNDLAFYTVADLSVLIKTHQITSVELTRFYLERLKKFDPQLHCVVTLTEDLAIQQAQKADEEIARGKYRGLLHGIPYGIKDLFALKGYKTTWGAAPFIDQEIDVTATVIRKLDDAGAILVAKLSMGELAMDDVWFGGMTRNPWDLEQGSSGSSAGSASATSAGLVAFAIGTETWGSIVSPSTRCGVSGLRPTFGRVSRSGVMALSWSMDKIGPICRDAEDCAIVFDAIRGLDGLDQSVIEMPFNYNSDLNLKNLRIGYLEESFGKDDEYRVQDSLTLENLRRMRFILIPVKLPQNIPVKSLTIILEAEASAAFEELTLNHKDTMLERQGMENWPNIFRRARLIPAVEYIQASRFRTQLIQEFNQLFEKVDVIVTSSFGGDQLFITNLTGNPCVVVPNGFDTKNHPTSISFIGKLFDEATILSFARKYQEDNGSHRQHPPLFQ